MARRTKPEPLTLRERQIAEAYAGGASYREIAERLFIAPTTVRTHLSAIYRKLGVSSKIGLLRMLERPGGDAQPEPPPDRPQTTQVGRPSDDPAVHISNSRRQERRKVALLVVDLDITSLDGGANDIELVQDRFSAFSGRARAEIAVVEGTVINEVGERLVACLGWPVAHEDDPGRAARAALAIREMIQGLRETGKLSLPSCRIGVAMGMIIASRTGNQHGEQDVFLGDVLGVVDKILAATKPNQILVDQETADRIAGAFDVRARDPNLEPRLSANQKVFAVEREVLAASRFDSRASARLLKMIGRDEELTFMEKR